MTDKNKDEETIANEMRETPKKITKHWEKWALVGIAIGTAIALIIIGINVVVKLDEIARQLYEIWIAM